MKNKGYLLLGSMYCSLQY